MQNNLVESVIVPVLLDELKDKEISLFVKREDLLHPLVSGNKFRKIKYNLQEAIRLNKTTLLTFGGAFSNHILATAAAGKENGLKTVGIIRGEELGFDLEKTFKQNPTLQSAKELGMEFEFVSREKYRLKASEKFLENLQKKYPEAYILPEGGTNDLAIKGCEEILDEKTDKFDFICVAAGTGGTLSGIIKASKENQKILGFPALKGVFLEEEIQKNVNKTNWKLIHDFHFGGYAKINEELITFVNDFKKETSMPLDPVYTGKMVFGIVSMIRNNWFPKKSKILFIHTGGLQGIAGMNELLKKRKLPLIE